MCFYTFLEILQTERETHTIPLTRHVLYVNQCILNRVRVRVMVRVRVKVRVRVRVRIRVSVRVRVTVRVRVRVKSDYRDTIQ